MRIYVLFLITILILQFSNCIIDKNPINIQNTSNPEEDYRLVFSCRYNNDFEIFTVHTDGSNLKRLTNSPGEDSNPSWSPDGNRILFISNRDGNHEIYTMDNDGKNLNRLTTNSVSDWQPCWSPDGNQIAYVSDIGDNDEIFIMNSDGSNKTRVTETSTGKHEWFPTWSKDGNKILYTSHGNLVQIDSSELYLRYWSNLYSKRLLQLNQNIHNPRWSVDERKILFWTSNNVYDFRIMVVDSNGMNITQLFFGGYHPSWSPDGSKIAFCLWDNDIMIMDSDGGNLKKITHSINFDYNPIWSNDGTTIYFHAWNHVEKLGKLMSVNTDGANEMVLYQRREWIDRPKVSPIKLP